MSLEGMDVEAAQNLARQLDGHAQALAHVTASIGGLAEVLGDSWHGPASAAFQQQCAAQYRPALGQAAQALRDMHAHLTANIQQQIRASAPGSEGGGRALAGLGAGFAPGLDAGLAAGLGAGLGARLTLAGIAGGIRRGWSDLAQGEGWEGLGQTFLDKTRELAGPADVPLVRADGRIIEDYGPNWQKLVSLDKGGSFFKYKESPLLNALHDDARVQRAGKILGSAHATAVLDKLDKAGKGLGDLNTAVSGGAAVGDLAQRHYARAVGSGLDATSSALMNSDNPAAFLAGFDLALLKKDYELGSKIDWSQGIPNPFNAANFRNDYVPTFRSLPGQLVSTLAGII